MLAVHNFSYGLLTPALGYLMSCLGAFLGLRCTARAMAAQGRARLSWLLLAALSIGTTGIWVMHFIAMLGYSVPDETIQYSVPLTIGSMLLAVVVVGIGLLIVGFAARTWRNLVLAGAFTGIGVAGMHYVGMAAMRMPARMNYNPALFGLSIVIAIVAATAALWAALRVRGTGATLVAALIMGVAVSGMHYTGMAAMHLYSPATGRGMLMSGGGATAENFLLPLIIGISVLAFILTATLALSPSDLEMQADAALLLRIEAARSAEQPAGLVAAQIRPLDAGHANGRATRDRRHGDSGNPIWPQ
jgi:NO-binding membrane sensor protein with MHYT domain